MLDKIERLKLNINIQISGGDKLENLSGIECLIWMKRYFCLGAGIYSFLQHLRLRLN